MARVLPLVTGNTIEQAGGRVEVETPAWYTWLEDEAVSFTFVGDRGRFTARKEQRGKTGLYWKAYCKQAGKLQTAYLGRSCDLTLARLEDVAARLAAQSAADHESPPLVPTPPIAPGDAAARPLGNSPDLPILATKLYMPAARRALVPRPRLETRLAEGLDGPVTVICAPAGFGKTTLLSGWLRASARPVAWLTLDEQDGDSIQLVRYVLAAAQTITPTLGGSLAALLAGPALPSATLLTRLVNELVQLPAGSILVLDDYHVVQGQAAHQVLTFLVEHLPPQLHLVIATREDPPLPLARLRTRGQLCELRTADLRFSAAEAAEFLTRIMGLPLAAAEIAALEARTEGWIAGLQLAALSMQGQADLPGFVAAFTGSHRYVLDYLAAEVLGRLPEPVYTFMVQTAIPDRLCAPLCAALLAEDGAATCQSMLERLERANLFLEALDNERYWYRYHRLFADLLRARLRKEQPALLPDLHRRAARWYAANDQPEQAIEHALAGADYALAARLVGERLEAVQQPSRLGTMLAWLEALPEEFI